MFLRGTVPAGVAERYTRQSQKLLPNTGLWVRIPPPAPMLPILEFKRNCRVFQHEPTAYVCVTVPPELLRITRITAPHWRSVRVAVIGDMGRCYGGICWLGSLSHRQARDAEEMEPLGQITPPSRTSEPDPPHALLFYRDVEHHHYGK